MSTLYLGPDLETLAREFAAAQRSAGGDFFVPVPVAVPNAYMTRWLQLWLARKNGIVINFQFKRLEMLMWELLCQVDLRRQPAPLELLNGNSYRLMILSILLDAKVGGTDVDPLRDHLHRHGEEPRRDVCRRAWQLAGRLGDLIRDYEYHRQHVLIQKWLRGQDGYPKDSQIRLERAQRALFHLITKEPDGLRAILSRKAKRLFKTLPQYAHEVMELPAAELAAPSQRVIHVFGITQISAMHIAVLRWLGARFDVRLYYLNPLVSRFVQQPLVPVLEESAWKDAPRVRATMQALAKRLREPRMAGTAVEDALLGAWSRAGAESLGGMAEILNDPQAFAAEYLAGGTGGLWQPAMRTSLKQKTATGKKSLAGSAGKGLFSEPVLACLQNHLLGKATDAEKVSQDRSLQIVACPGILREVETVYQSILHNLREDSSLKQTDIAILVTDMARYRPVIQSVFDRRPGFVHYNLADFTAAGLSAFGHGVLGLLDLALESFTRARVFAVLLNPCFLARLGVERDQALAWFEWAEELGIYHGWDAKDKEERGYAGTPLYSWQLGLRRLRLGRLMDAGAEPSATAVPAFKEIVPFANLASSDKEQLDDFCRAVEGLLPALHRLRGLKLSGGRWASELRRLIDNFLDVPEERPAEAAVRDQLFHTLTELHYLDLLAGAENRQPKLPLSLMREFVADNLACVEGRRGDLLTGGVTISALRPFRPIPFRIVYIVGLGEGAFPGSDVPSTFDLHSRERLLGDIRPVEANRFVLFEELLAARDKLYLLYDCRDLQKDQTLHPCGPLNQLRRYLAEHITGGEFKITPAPLCGNDVKCLGYEESSYTDVLINYDESERLQALQIARRGAALKLDAALELDLQRRLDGARRDFSLPATAAGGKTAVPTVRLAELRGFLRSPAEAALKRHLRLEDEEEPEAADAEPFSTPSPRDHWLIRSALQDFVARATAGSVTEALQSWPERFTMLYEAWRLRGRVPDGAFAEADRSRFEQQLRQRIEGADGLGDFVAARRQAECCGPLLLGESLTPLGARRRFPALLLFLPQEVRVVGSLALAWRSGDAFEVLVLSNVSGRNISEQDICYPLLEPFLFYLALRAGTAAGDGPSSAEWLGDREFRVHVSHQQGITSFAYAAADVSPAEARAYLAQAIADFLDRSSFEVLPFNLIVQDKNLKQAYILPDGAAPAEQLREGYRRELEDAYEQDQDKDDHPTQYTAELVQLVDLPVAQDAFDKVRRRFRLLDRGPARIRGQEESRA